MKAYLITEYISYTPWQRFKADVADSVLRLRIKFAGIKLYLKVRLTGRGAVFYSYSDNSIKYLNADEIKTGFLPWTFPAMVRIPGSPHRDGTFIIGETFWISIKGRIHYMELF